MPGLRCLAVDPNETELAKLCYLLELDGRVSNVAAVQDLQAAADKLEQHAADAIFIAIAEHPVNLLHEFSQLPSSPTIIAVSPSSDYAQLAFDLGAIDFIVKPLQATAVERAIKRLMDKGCCHAVDPRSYRISVTRNSKLRFIDPRDILYIETEGDYTHIISTEGADPCRLPLSSLTKQLEPYGFIRIHRRWLVSATKITEFVAEDGKVFVRVGAELLPVARRHITDVKSRLV